MASFIELTATGLMVCAAGAVAVAAVHHEFATPQPPPNAAKAVVTGYVQGWEQLSAVGDWIGDSMAKVKIVEFGDFECPFCQRFHQKYLEAQKLVGKDVALLFVEFPLPSHRFAKPAALAAECALAKGRFGQFHDALFEKQDSFGLIGWASYAQTAGIQDTIEFNQCVRSRTRSDRLDSAVAIGTRYKLHGTPTVIVNGWRYGTPPYDSLASIVRTALKRAKG